MTTSGCRASLLCRGPGCGSSGDSARPGPGAGKRLLSRLHGTWRFSGSLRFAALDKHESRRRGPTSYIIQSIEVRSKFRYSRPIAYTIYRPEVVYQYRKVMQDTGLIPSTLIDLGSLRYYEPRAVVRRTPAGLLRQLSRSVRGSSLARTQPRPQAVDHSRSWRLVHRSDLYEPIGLVRLAQILGGPGTGRGRDRHRRNSPGSLESSWCMIGERETRRGLSERSFWSPPC